MANTGKVIVLTLKEVHSSTGEATGIPPEDNTSSHEGYITPYLNVTKCPITYTTVCPTLMKTPGSTTVIFEFSLPNSTLFNPDISTVRIKAMLSGSPASTVDFTLPNPSGNYFLGTLTGLAPSTLYTIEIDYLNSSSIVISNCTTPGTVTTL